MFTTCSPDAGDVLRQPGETYSRRTKLVEFADRSVAGTTRRQALPPLCGSLTWNRSSPLRSAYTVPERSGSEPDGAPLPSMSSKNVPVTTAARVAPNPGPFTVEPG